MKMKRCCSLLIGLAVFSVLLPSPTFGMEPEEVWRRLGNLSGAERETLLLSKAKEEGEVVWYGNIGMDSLEPLKKDFEKRYPEVKVKVWRGSGERTSNRVLTEKRAGKTIGDVIGPGNEHMPILLKAGLVGRYSSPERRFFSKAYKDIEGYWTSYVYNLAVMAYNTSLVPRSQAPKNYEDFLDAKWKGSFAMDSDPDRALMVWLKIWGEEKTEKFLQGLIKNDVAVRRGHTLMTQLLCVGEFKAAVELYSYRVAELKHKGCPVEMVFPDPTPGAVTPLIIAKQSPHPYAAALLVDYVLSERGQRLLAEKGWYSGRRGIKLKYPEIDVKKRGVSVLVLRPDDADQLGKKYFQLRERFLLRR